VNTHQAERRPHAVDMVRLSHRIGTVVMNVNPALTAIRDAITASGIIPTAKAWLACHEASQPHFTDGCGGPWHWNSNGSCPGGLPVSQPQVIFPLATLFR
jgi:3-(3-hydroxy-phenyl)propionate hydroxylase